jgi:hypothetical protein
VIPAPTLKIVAKELVQRPVPVIALLFAPPETAVGKERIVPRIGYLDERTADYVHFFCAGYSGFGSEMDVTDARQVTADGDRPQWFFSQRAFGRFINEIEGRWNWKYSGESDLLLLEPRYHVSDRDPEIDLSEVLDLKLEKLARDGAIDHASSLLESIIRFARTRRLDGLDGGTSRFSDREALRIGGRAMLGAILRSLPKSVQQLWREGQHFRVQDLRR